VGYRFKLWWLHYTAGVRERYKLLMTPAHPGFFLPWVSYVVFVAAALRWQIDVFLLLILLWRHCVTPSTSRLEHEIEWLPLVMAGGVAIMALTLLPKQKEYARAIPLWIGEAFATLLPIALILAMGGLLFFWFELRSACG